MRRPSITMRRECRPLIFCSPSVAFTLSPFDWSLIPLCSLYYASSIKRDLPHLMLWTRARARLVHSTCPRSCYASYLLCHKDTAKGTQRSLDARAGSQYVNVTLFFETPCLLIRFYVYPFLIVSFSAGNWPELPHYKDISWSTNTCISTEKKTKISIFGLMAYRTEHLPKPFFSLHYDIEFSSDLFPIDNYHKTFKF